MDDLHIRPAAASDQRTIRQMVWDARLDPSNLGWESFLVAERKGEVVGIGQIRRATPELGSLVVREDLRGEGIGGALVRALIEEVDGDLYLECRAALTSFYEQFGFERIPWHKAPFPLKFKAGMGSLLGFNIATMVHRGAQR